MCIRDRVSNEQVLLKNKTDFLTMWNDPMSGYNAKQKDINPAVLDIMTGQMNNYLTNNYPNLATLDANAMYSSLKNATKELNLEGNSKMKFKGDFIDMLINYTRDKSSEWIGNNQLKIEEYIKSELLKKYQKAEPGIGQQDEWEENL